MDEHITKKETNTAITNQSRLEKLVRNYAQHSLAKSTQKYYDKDWRFFAKWCAEYDFSALPALPNTVAAYIADHASKGLSPSTIARRLCAIKLRHESRGYDSPTRDHLVKATMSGIKRSYGKAVVQKVPLTADLLDKVLNFHPYNLRKLRDKALLSIGFAGALRRSEIVALKVSDIKFTPEGMKITIPKSKTDQEGRGQTIAILNGDRFCVVDTLRMWLQEAKIAEGYLFCPFQKGGRVRSTPLTHRSVANIIKHYASKAGLNAEDFSGHSLRSGFLTSAASAGVGPFKMMEVSRHKNMTTLAGYVRSENLFEDHAGETFL